MRKPEGRCVNQRDTPRGKGTLCVAKGRCAWQKGAVRGKRTVPKEGENMAVILAGDLHGMLDLDKVTEYFETNDEYTKEDYLILLGDTGILWDGYEGDRELQEILNELPVTTLWIDGNHDNFDLLEEYETDTWHGGKVHFITDSIIHLCRGQVFEICGRTFFTFGGGNSIDKAIRQEGISWWPEEMPSDYEYEEGRVNLEKTGGRVDYILTHTCPEYVAHELVTDVYPGEEALQRYLNQIAEDTDFEMWYFGHWHIDETVDNFQCLYHEIVEIEL